MNTSIVLFEEIMSHEKNNYENYSAILKSFDEAERKIRMGTKECLVSMRTGLDDLCKIHGINDDYCKSRGLKNDLVTKINLLVSNYQFRTDNDKKNVRTYMHSVRILVNNYAHHSNVQDQQYKDGELEPALANALLMFYAVLCVFLNIPIRHEYTNCISPVYFKYKKKDNKYNLLLDFYTKLRIDQYIVIERYKKEKWDSTIKGNYTYKAMTNQKEFYGMENRSLHSYFYIIPVSRYSTSFASDREHLVQTELEIAGNNSPYLLVNPVLLPTDDTCSCSYIINSIKEDAERLDVFIRNQAEQGNRPLQNYEILDIALQIANALISNANAISHRNINPAAIFVMRNDKQINSWLTRFEHSKISDLDSNQTVAPNLVETITQSQSKFNFINVKSLDKSIIFKMNNNDFHKLDVYSIAVVMAYCINQKNGITAIAKAGVFSARGFSDSFCAFLDKIFCADAVEHIPDLQRFAEELEVERKQTN